MARATPSLTALLGLLAIAGYQNRDKLSEMLKGASAGDPARMPGGAAPGGLGNSGGLLSGAASAGGIGGLLTNGLKDLVDRFNAAGDRETAESWVGSGPNKQCTAESLRRAIGPDTLADLRAHTGLSEDELVARLCRTLPEAVDKYTPEGRLS